MSEEKSVEDYIREMAGEEPKPKPEPQAEEQEATATSDDSADEATEEQETEADEGESAEEQEASDDDEAPDDSEEDEEDKPKRRRARPDPKKRIRKLVAERNSERDENARLRAQIDVLMQQAQPGQKPAEQPPAQTQDDDPKPQQDQYDDYAKYIEDRSAWASRQAVKEALAEAGKQAAQNQQKQTAEAKETELVTQAKALFEKGTQEFDDFEEIAADPDLPVTEAMTAAMLASDIGHQVQYHLGSHPEEAQRISKLDPVQQVREMALLEASLTAPKAKPRKKTTSAPEPIKPVGGKSAPKSVDEDSIPIDEYMRKFNAGELPSQKI